MPEALRRRSPQYRRCLLPSLTQVARSKDRYERTVGGDAYRTGSPDARRNKASFVRSPLRQSSRRSADVERDRSCSFSSRTRASGELDVIFSVAGTVDPGHMKICHHYFPVSDPAPGSAQIGFSPIGESTMRPIVPTVYGKVIFGTVPLSTATKLSDDEKLEALRRLDQFRQWPSLEEKRYCLVCGKIITGQEIQVVGGTRGNGALRMNCPTEGCNSIPMDWVLPTDEILAKAERMAIEQRGASAVKPPAGTNGHGRTVRAGRESDDFVSRLRKFAFHFKRHA